MGGDALDDDLPWCATCGKDISWARFWETRKEGGECNKCEQWWAENSP